MQLVHALAAGVYGAGNGTARLYRFNTTSEVAWYENFDGSGAQSAGTQVSLDSFGGATVYVDELVTVEV
jgi:hypothetical protein